MSLRLRFNLDFAACHRHLLNLAERPEVQLQSHGSGAPGKPISPGSPHLQFRVRVEGIQCNKLDSAVIRQFCDHAMLALHDRHSDSAVANQQNLKSLPVLVIFSP